MVRSSKNLAPFVMGSMVAQHAKWLKVCNQLPWRQSIASLNLILSSNVWQQDHNGYTHQDPGFLDHIANKKADVVRLYLPPDANCLLSCFDRFHLVKDVIQHLPQLGNRGAHLIQQMNDKLVEHKNYIHEVGQDMPEILNWKWHLPQA